MSQGCGWPASELTVVQTLSVLEQPRCAMEYVLRPPLAASDHEIVLVSPGPGRVKLIWRD